MGRLGSRLPRYPIGTIGVTDVINLEDNEKLNLGTSKDVAIHWDGSNLVFDPLSGEDFTIDFSSGRTDIYGGPASGNDISIRANVTDGNPKITLYGNSNAEYQVKSTGSSKFIFGSTTGLQISYSSNVTTVEGGGVSGDDLVLKANSTDARPVITMTGNGQIYYDTPSNHTFQDSGTTCLEIIYASNVTTVEGGAVSGDDLKLKASSADDYPYVICQGNSDLSLYGVGAVKIYNQTTKLAQFGNDGASFVVWLYILTATVLKSTGYAPFHVWYCPMSNLLGPGMDLLDTNEFGRIEVELLSGSSASTSSTPDVIAEFLRTVP